MADLPFWKKKSLTSMTAEEWESLCDGCGRCCLQKIEDEDTGEIHYTRVACRLLDPNTSRCSHYRRRKEYVSDCVVLKPELIDEFQWLPNTCAYRLVAEGQDLPSWHPLISGDPKSVHEALMSVGNWSISEDLVDERDWSEQIIRIVSN